MRLDFLGIGPQRTASSWLHEAMTTHPALCLPAGVKETFFFDERYAKGLAWYAAHFRHCGAGLIGEVGPSYFDVPEVPARVRSVAPQVRLVTTLRHPVERAESLFRHHYAKGRVPREFAAAAERLPRIVTAGHYAEHLTRWFEGFGRERVLVLLQDDLAADPRDTLRRVWRFLGVSDHEPPAANRPVNQASAPLVPLLARVAAASATWLRSHRLHGIVEQGKRLGLTRVYRGAKRLPSLTPEQRTELAGRYAGDVEFVERLVGRALPHWRTSGTEPA